MNKYTIEWDKHGKSAGYFRNKAMLDSGVDVVVCIYNGYATKGTAHMARISKELGIPTHELDYGYENKRERGMNRTEAEAYIDGDVLQ